MTPSAQLEHHQPHLQMEECPSREHGFALPTVNKNDSLPQGYCIKAFISPTISTTSGLMCVEPLVGHKIPSTRSSNKRQIIHSGMIFSSLPNKVLHTSPLPPTCLTFDLPFFFPFPTVGRSKTLSGGVLQLSSITSAKSPIA
ncbi:hypothetical protein N665_0035s0006 [Sinapis alba]|nr:hypothetical protein N665_0035s0006 [Sinapis alba]